MEQRIKLTDKQQQLVDKLNDLLEEMYREEIQIVYDRSQYSFAAINAKNILNLQDSNEQDKDAVNIENEVIWGNIHNMKTHDYYSGYGDLYAVFDI